MTNRPYHSTRPPAHVQPFYEVLGEADTIRFLLSFGGAVLYRTVAPAGRSKLADMFGVDVARALAVATEHAPARIPTAKPWIAQVWSAQGVAVNEIARRLHVSDVSVRGWLKRAVKEGVEAGDEPRQLRLI